MGCSLNSLKRGSVRDYIGFGVLSLNSLQGVIYGTIIGITKGILGVKIRAPNGSMAPEP